MYEKRVDANDLPFFIGLMDIGAPGSVSDAGGRPRRVAYELAGRPAAIVTFLDGVWPRRVAVHCRALGGAGQTWRRRFRDGTAEQIAVRLGRALTASGRPPTKSTTVCTIC